MYESFTAEYCFKQVLEKLKLGDRVWYARSWLHLASCCPVKGKTKGDTALDAWRVKVNFEGEGEDEYSKEQCLVKAAEADPSFPATWAALETYCGVEGTVLVSKPGAEAPEEYDRERCKAEYLNAAFP